VKLKEIRKARGLTQVKLATMCGASQVRISQYECGTREPNLDMLRKLATALNVTIDELVK